MFGIRFISAKPTTYVMQLRNRKIIREGPGLSFLYFAPTSSILQIPIGSRDLPFVFHETTSDFQTVTVQGQLIFRIAEPRKAVELLDFSVEGNGAYESKDPEQLPERLVQALQAETKKALTRLSLKEALNAGPALSKGTLESLRTAAPVEMLGLEILELLILNIAPTPETARALEAEAREALLGRSDEAVYARRNAAVEQERLIKENELKTELAVEEKKREIAQSQMAAKIAVETQRAELIAKKTDNDRKEADTRAYALETTVKALAGADWKTLVAAHGENDPKLMIAMAFREMAENAGKVGQLNITPDLLAGLIARKGG